MDQLGQVDQTVGACAQRCKVLVHGIVICSAEEPDASVCKCVWSNIISLLGPCEPSLIKQPVTSYFINILHGYVMIPPPQLDGACAQANVSGRDSHLRHCITSTTVQSVNQHVNAGMHTSRLC